MNISIKLTKNLVFLGTNYLLLFFSRDIDIEQFQKALYIFFENDLLFIHPKLPFCYDDEELLFLIAVIPKPNSLI